jgi:hypothetical protein
MKLLLPLLAAASLAPGLLAQTNKVPGRDATLRIVDTLRSFGREGTYPNGSTGFANGVTVCNIGSVDIGWYAPMNADHPVYAPMIVRVTDERIEQISDWSYVKHGFSSINGSVCGSCGTSNSSILGPNCSDTYGSGLNADRYWLGPPGEIDPWLGAWNPRGSHFDRGQPDVGFPQNQDGSRSLSRSMADALPPVEHRVAVADADLQDGNARYYYGMYVVIAGEPGGVRDDNWCYRQFRPTWSGASWTVSDLSNPTNGSPLQFWTGARISQARNGEDDGAFYVAVRVTGPDARGLWHYEYALQNRDNSRGGASFRLPICPEARLTNASFRDIDGSAANDWSIRMQGGELAFFAPAGQNALEWNTIYNFSFDCDVGPVDGNVSIDQARPGGGAATVTIATQVPGIQFSRHLGAACGGPGPELFPTGTPPFAVIPNPGFGLRIETAAPGASLAVLVSALPGNLDLGNGCRLWTDVATTLSLASATADGQGEARVGVPVPNDPSLEGADLNFQAVELVNGGPVFGAFELSNGLRVRLGNQTSGCR